jgi:hypothetical protein
MDNEKIFYQKESFWAVLLGIIGCFALAWNLYVEPNDWPSIIVNFAQIGVAVIVFFVANNVFRELKKAFGKREFNFNERFEENLKEWAIANAYLIDTSEINIPKGNQNKRSIQMICKHADMVNCNNASTIADKGSFLYLPTVDELGKNDGNKIEFKINKSMFAKNKEIFDDYDNQKKEITSKIANAIKIKFGALGISAVGKDDRISVDFSEFEKNDENAKKLIEIVEFVKTLFLAVA